MAFSVAVAEGGAVSVAVGAVATHYMIFVKRAGMAMTQAVAAAIQRVTAATQSGTVLATTMKHVMAVT